MSNEQDMRVMGGLRKKLPVTWITFLVGTLAIAGIFPLAGFFSKDEILWKTWSSGHHALWVVGFLAAGLTAFYMMRLLVLTFLGENRASPEVRSHIHESPATMTVPLVVLAILSVVGGWISIPAFMGGGAHLEHWLEPVFATGAAHGGHAAAAGHGGGEVAHDTTMEWFLAIDSLLWAVLCLFAGWFVYTRRVSIATAARNLGGGFAHRVLENKYYVDEFNEAVFIRPGYRLSRSVLWKVVDAGIIDGLLVNGSALTVAVIGSLLRLFQNGMVRFYAWSITIGLTVFVLYLVFSG